MMSRDEFLDDDVDVINLIDLMVVLCAMLMLLLPATTALHELRGLPPGTGTPSTATADLPQAPIVRFTADGHVLWNQEAVRLDELATRQPPSTQPVIYVAGDPLAHYELSVAVSSRLQSAGWEVKELMQPEGETP